MTEAPANAGRLIVDGEPIAFEPGDSVAIAIVRSGGWPSAGGTLCLAGDCGNCLVEAAGVAYVRSCQVASRDGLEVRRHPAHGKPILPDADEPAPEVAVVRKHIRKVVVGGGDAGDAAVEAELRLDSSDGDEVVAIYPGPAVVARTSAGMLHAYAGEVLVATGTVEIHPVVPGNRLAGLLTRRAHERLSAAGVDLGRVVTVGEEIDRFEGDDAGRVRAVVTRDGRAIETDTAVVDLGLASRDLLARMAPGVPTAGSAARDYPLPPPASAGVVCGCMATTVADLDAAWDNGYTDIELLKRASWAGLGPCQGGACLPHLRAFLAARSGTIPEPFTARPAARQITLAEAAADVAIDAFRQTPLHDEHLALGARMDRFGGWWRPWHYGDAIAEYHAVRERVSLGDVSTLGKLVVSGADAAEALDRLYPCHVADIKPGRSRYALLLNERGHVMDDGMIVREAETRFVLTFTSGGAANAEMWVRDWIETWGLRVHVMDRTMSLAAINVTGPRARELLERAGLAEPPRYLGHARADVAGVPCHVMRLSFTGEASFELHHPIDGSVELWRSLMALGADMGIAPHGLQALFGLRLEKGHVIVGMDTELDTTPARLGMDWAVRMEKPFFIGRASLQRTSKLPQTRRWVGFTLDGEAPVEGSPIWSAGEIVGNVTGSWTSPALGRALVLGWQKRAPFPDEVEIDGRRAAVTPTPFYDPEGLRARA
ncbi:MAG: 2Fe-2S iron-sulfur cluster-binding protein [Chloroflexota bacterium]